MSRFTTSEEYYAARDSFVAYIDSDVNPARQAAGLSLIREAEARECFRLIEEFMDRLMGRTTDQQPTAPTTEVQK